MFGEDGILEGHRVHSGGSIPDSAFTTDTIPNHGLKRIHSVPSMPGKWDKVRFDEATQILAVASTEGSKLAVCAYETSHDDDRWTSTDLPGQLTALAFQVRTSSRRIGERQSPLFAAAFEDGACALYTCRWPLEANAKPSIESLVTVHASSGPALALAWTPDGAHLAVGGTELVQIWETASLVHFDIDANRLEKKADAQLRPLVTWRPDATATGPRNGEHEPARPLTEPSLSWSSDGESLAFAVDKQVRLLIIRVNVSVVHANAVDRSLSSGSRIPCRRGNGKRERKSMGWRVDRLSWAGCIYTYIWIPHVRTFVSLKNRIHLVHITSFSQILDKPRSSYRIALCHVPAAKPRPFSEAPSGKATSQRQTALTTSQPIRPPTPPPPCSPPASQPGLPAWQLHASPSPPLAATRNLQNQPPTPSLLSRCLGWMALMLVRW